MKKILILYAHPRSVRSQVNTAMVESIQGMENVTVADLYAEYPTFEIDIDKEQQRLLDHDIIIFQHPIYWYSSPALLKEWQDVVLEHGFAYGSKGKALTGKVLLNAVTCGARKESYLAEGSNHSTVKGFLKPFEATAHLCNMNYLPPFVLYGAGHSMDENRLEPHIKDYKKLLESLLNEKVNYDDLNDKEEINTILENLR